MFKKLNYFNTLINKKYFKKNFYYFHNLYCLFEILICLNKQIFISNTEFHWKYLLKIDYMFFLKLKFQNYIRIKDFRNKKEYINLRLVHEMNVITDKNK